MNMKRTGKLLTTAALIALGVAGITVNGPATAGIASTKHNLSSTGTGTNKFSGTQAICVFCHTPHGADTSAAVPLWNRILSSPSSYTTYDSLGTSTIDGEIAPVGSVSIACLSCHDGTQAMNVMINAPGSGGYDPVSGTTLPGSWTGPASSASPVGSLNYATPSIVNIGTDLTNDHPIGIQYGGGGIDSTNPTGTTKDPDFNTTDLQHAIINGKDIWWVDTPIGTGGTREKTDIQLYTRNDFSGGNPEPSVECASCHNPHTSDNPTFLRIANTGSAVCLACHVK